MENKIYRELQAKVYSIIYPDGCKCGYCQSEDEIVQAGCIPKPLELQDVLRAIKSKYDNKEFYQIPNGGVYNGFLIALDGWFDCGNLKEIDLSKKMWEQDEEILKKLLDLIK